LALKSDSKESLSIKGCILAESGISEKSRTKLALSKEIFERLANQDDSWVIYYNLGNVLSGLEEYPEAKKSYLRAIDNNSEIAEVWSNFGRCLHHLKEHEQELSCFDKAISLNPGLSQAFVSKAVTLGKVYEKYKAAIEILDFTLERDPNVERGFPFFWSWRTQFLLELDDIHSAFDSVETGLVNFPDEHSLLEMKSFILSNLWSKESAYLERAEVFFKMRAYSNLNDYRPFIELAKISIEKNNLDISLEYIRQALNILSPMQEISIETLKLLRFSIENLINSIAHVSIYQGFRKSSSVSVPYFFEGLDEILICIYKLSWICFFVSFNDLFHFFIEALKPDFEQKGEIEIASTLLEAFKISHFNAGRDIVKITNVIGVIYSDYPQDFKINVMTSLMLALPEMALVESSRQIGYLVGSFGINSEILEKVQLLVGKILGDWVQQLSAEVGRIINSHFALLNDSTESATAD
jgi:tetratricopeptide (TPR) repeat protein